MAGFEGKSVGKLELRAGSVQNLGGIRCSMKHALCPGVYAIVNASWELTKDGPW